MKQPNKDLLQKFGLAVEARLSDREREKENREEPEQVWEEEEKERVDLLGKVYISKWAHILLKNLNKKVIGFFFSQ